jgi:hypothetical protein
MIETFIKNIMIFFSKVFTSVMEEILPLENLSGLKPLFTSFLAIYLAYSCMGKTYSFPFNHIPIPFTYEKAIFL